jgi:(1->4)-alpha-D-glucan 1-alpha-D-glucosylmutase
MDGSVLELAKSWRDGAVKQALIRTILQVRKSHPALFADGAYCPLSVEGAKADHLIAFARRNGDDALIVLAARLPLRMLGEQLSIPASAWADTRVSLPSDLSGRPLLNLLSPTPIPKRIDQASVAHLLDGFPLAAFMQTSAAAH